jgi:hypothetical protein
MGAERLEREAVKLDTECCILECEQPATVFTEGLSLCPRHYLEMDREHKRLMSKSGYSTELSARF